MKKIQMVDLKGQYEKIASTVNASIQEVLDTNTYINGPQVQSFQKNLQKNLQKFGKYLLRLLDGRIFRFVAIAVIGCLCLSWLFLALEKLPVDSQIVKVISMIESYIEPYLPIAIISLRKLIMDNLGTIFFKSAFIVKFFFGRFVR